MSVFPVRRSRPVARRLLAAAVLLLAARPAPGRQQPAAAAEPPAATAPAEPPAPPPPPRNFPRVPPTRLGVETLARSPLVVVGRTASVRPVSAGTDLVHVRVLERVRGEGVRPGDEVAVLCASGQFLFGVEELLFLRPWRDGPRQELVARVSSLEEHYLRGLSLVRRAVFLSEIPELQARTEATLELLFGLLRDDDDWVRGYALSELRWMAQRQPWIWTVERIGRLRAAGRSNPRPEVAAGVESVASMLSSPPSGTDPEARTGQSPP